MSNGALRLGWYRPISNARMKVTRIQEFGFLRHGRLQAVIKPV
ncbi:Unknown protein sequence [Pseudomonas coronafaciens pv. oryzae]|nr:Unknown protein sequence [Pseudomonas coronafaciens pv. oryzae]